MCGPSSLPWNLGFCSLSPLQSFKTSSGCVASAHNMHLRGCSKHVVLLVCFIQQLIQDGIIVHNSALLEFRYPTLGPKFCHEYLSNPLQINFLATGTLAANDFHSALPTPVRLLIYSSCFSWSGWCMCFVILLMCHICCIVAYTSLSSF